MAVLSYNAKASSAQHPRPCRVVNSPMLFACSFGGKCVNVFDYIVDTRDNVPCALIVYYSVPGDRKMATT